MNSNENDPNNPGSPAEISPDEAFSPAELEAIRQLQAMLDPNEQGNDQARPETPDGLGTLREVINENVEREDVLFAVTFASFLTSGSYHDEIKNLVREMGFDSDNLQEVMRAIFSAAKGKVVPKTAVKEVFRRPNRPFYEILYRDLLGLAEGASREEVAEKVDILVKKMEPLQELLSFDEKRVPVMQAIAQFKREQNPQRKYNIARDNSLEGVGQVFDKDAAQAMLQDVDKFSADAVSRERQMVIDSGKPEIDFEADFQAYSENQSNPNTFFHQLVNSDETKMGFAQLRNLHLALRRSDEAYGTKNKLLHFGGKERPAVLAELDGALGMRLREAMQEAAKASNEPIDPTQCYALTQAIANYYGLSRNAEKLKVKLVEISGVLEGLFPGLELRAKK